MNDIGEKNEIENESVSTLAKALYVINRKEARITALEQALEIAREGLEFYSDPDDWFCPQACNDYLHGHAGHVCPTNKWGFNFKRDGCEKAAYALSKIDAVLKEGK